MSREMWSAVREFRNGESLNAETLNVPVGQLADRTAYLYARLKELIGSGKMSSVVLTGVELYSDPAVPDVGSAVYLDNESGKFKAARATMTARRQRRFSPSTVCLMPSTALSRAFVSMRNCPSSGVSGALSLKNCSMSFISGCAV